MPAGPLLVIVGGLLLLNTVGALLLEPARRGAALDGPVAAGLVEVASRDCWDLVTGALLGGAPVGGVLPGPPTADEQPVSTPQDTATTQAQANPDIAGDQEFTTR